MIEIDFRGRLGNKMFEYATCRSISELNGYNYFINNFDSELSEYFNIENGIKNGNITNFINDDDFLSPTFQNKEKFIEESTNKMKLIKDFTKLNGFWQKEIYFHWNFKNICKWFSPKKLDINEFNYLLNKYPIDEYVYIHFRGTDYYEILKMGKTMYFAPYEYYKYCMETYDNKKFLVITDDLRLANEFFINDNIDIISNEIDIDFELLKNAKNLIINWSTFGWWSGYLNTNYEKIYCPYGRFDFNIDEHFYPIEKFNYIKI